MFPRKTHPCVFLKLPPLYGNWLYLRTDPVVAPPFADSPRVAVNREVVVQFEKSIVMLTGIELAGARFPSCTGKACADPPFTLAVPTIGCEVQAAPPLC